MGVKIQLLRGTAADWTTKNPTLDAGQPGFEIDTFKLKIGDGLLAWNDLPYVSGGMGGGGGPLNYSYGTDLLIDNNPPTKLFANSISNGVDYSDYFNFIKDNNYNVVLKISDSSGNESLLSGINIQKLNQTLTNVPVMWPSNSTTFIEDGGNDQYDDANYINTSFTYEGTPTSSNDFADLDVSSAPYNDGNVGSSSVWGDNSYVTLYKKNIFAMVAKGSSNMPSMVTFAGDTGSDGDGNKDNGTLTNYNGYQAGYARLYGDDPTYTKLIITKTGTTPTYFIDQANDTDDDLFGASGVDSDTIAMVVLYGLNKQSPSQVSDLQTIFESFVDNVLVDSEDCDTVKDNFYSNFNTIYTSVFSNFWYDNFQFFVGSGKKITNIATTSNNGTGLTIDLSINNENQKYILTINNAGYNYQIDDSIILPGENITYNVDYYDNTVSGDSPDNDILFTVISVDNSGAVTGLNIEGTNSSVYYTFDTVKLQDSSFIELNPELEYYLNIDIIGTNPKDLSNTDLSVCSLQITGNPYYADDPVTVYQKNSTQPNKVYDKIDNELTLARGTDSWGGGSGGGGLYNSETQNSYDDGGDNGPAGTEWNGDGWNDLSDITSRSYDSLYDVLNGTIGEKITNAKLVMHDTINDKYYKFDFTWWQPGGGVQGDTNQNGIGGFKYTRTLLWVDQPVITFVRGNNQPNVVDEIDTGLTIKRANGNGAIFNSLSESSWDPNISPKGTLWNIEGWDDLTNIAKREYVSFYSATGGRIGNNVLVRDYVMFDTINNKYYKVKFTNWEGGNGNNSAVSYTRQQINGHCAGELKFSDGSIQNTAFNTNSVNDAINDAIGAKQSYKLFRQTTDNTSNVVLTTDKEAPAVNLSNLLVIPQYKAWNFNIQLIARGSDDKTNSWNFRGCLHRKNDSTTYIVGSVIEENNLESAVSASVVADDTNKALELRVTGLLSTTIEWVANVDIVEAYYD